MVTDALPASGYTLIGLPGSGKSTVGVQLAKSLARPFVDTDIELQQRIGESLQAYLDNYGIEALREAEAACICSLKIKGHVIATGGSAVYSDEAIAYLSEHSRLIYLQNSYESMIDRLGNYAGRGIAADLSHGLRPMYEERIELYRRYADVVVDANNVVPDVVAEILDNL